MAYSMLKSMAERGQENRASAVRDLLCSNGFAFAWWNRSVGDKTRSLTNFSGVLQIVSFKIGIPDGKLVEDVKCTELLKVL